MIENPQTLNETFIIQKIRKYGDEIFNIETQQQISFSISCSEEKCENQIQTVIMSTIKKRNVKKMQKESKYARNYVSPYTQKSVNRNVIASKSSQFKNSNTKNPLNTDENNEQHNKQQQKQQQQQQQQQKQQQKKQQQTKQQWFYKLTSADINSIKKICQQRRITNPKINNKIQDNYRVNQLCCNFVKKINFGNKTKMESQNSHNNWRV